MRVLTRLWLACLASFCLVGCGGEPELLQCSCSVECNHFVSFEGHLAWNNKVCISEDVEEDNRPACAEQVAYDQCNADVANDPDWEHCDYLWCSYCECEATDKSCDDDQVDYCIEDL